MNTETKSRYPRSAGILALVGGIIILLGGALFILASVFILPHMNFPNVNIPKGLPPADLPALISGVVGIMGTFGVICGSVVLISAALLLAAVGSSRTWGILILVFSLLSFIGLGGFVVGAILGILGGIFTLRWKQPGSSG